MSDDEIRAAFNAAWGRADVDYGMGDSAALDARDLAGLRAVERAARAAAFREAAEAIPTSWLGPLLSGPDKISPLPYNGPAMERFLHALRDRLRARAEGPK